MTQRQPKGTYTEVNRRLKKAGFHAYHINMLGLLARGYEAKTPRAVKAVQILEQLKKEREDAAKTQSKYSLDNQFDNPIQQISDLLTKN